MTESSGRGPATNPSATSLQRGLRNRTVTRAPLKIISGGQTGVDQGALAAALECGATCGGWCPAGRLSEDGVISATYPVQELPGSDYIERTLRNVQDSDGTAIIFSGELEGGTRLTRTFCRDESKPHVLIDASTMSEPDAIEALLDFITSHRVETLNVAGPRASKWPEAHARAQALLTALLKKTPTT